MTIYLIRHAQSAFNAVHDPNKPDPMIFDAPITELGKTQAIQARSEVEKFEIKNVIVSPFTRTLQTALLIFGKNNFLYDSIKYYTINTRKSFKQLLKSYIFNSFYL